MANIIVPDKPSKDVIRVNGVCYQLVGSTASQPTNTMDDIEGEFDSCEGCFLEESSSSGGGGDESESSSADCSNPAMKLTVTGSTGTINWCGETWNLPGDSGTPIKVCSTYYRKSRLVPSTNPAGTYSAVNAWDFAGGTGLRIARKYAISPNTASTKFLPRYNEWWNRIRLFDNSADAGWNFFTGQFGVFYTRPVGYAYTYNQGPLDLREHLPGSPPRSNVPGGYDITAGMLDGSYTKNSVVYKWEPADGW